MELKVFRDILCAGGGCCAAKAEIPVETEILISDYLPQVFKVVKCFVRPVVLQKQLQPGRLTLEGYVRCTVYYQGEDGAGLCQAEQKLPFHKVLELPDFPFTAWSAVVEGQTEYINCRAVTPRRIEVRGAYGLTASVCTQCSTEVITRRAPESSAIAHPSLIRTLPSVSSSRTSRRAHSSCSSGVLCSSRDSDGCHTSRTGL